MCFVKRGKNDRKIGAVVVIHKNFNNYGSSLQGFATIVAVQKLGFQIRVIRYIKKRAISELLRTIPFLILSGALISIKRSIKAKINKKIHPEYAKNISIRTNKVNKFKTTHFDPISDYYKGYTSLSEGSKKYSVVFVGSDQVWGPLSLYSKFYNLLFVNDSVPRFSYASSFGSSHILPWQKKGIAEYLNRMNYIGVREIRGKEIVEELTSKTAQVVLDPTFLLSKKEWEEYSKQSSFNIKEPYIFCYILGNRSDIRQEVLELKKQTGYKIVSMNHVDGYRPEDNNLGDITPYDVDAFDFIKLLSNATCVCTDSFHGSVFSLVFHKQFMVFYRHKKNSLKSTQSRIDSLLKIFDCESRLFKFDGKDLKSCMEQPIDYHCFEEKLNTLRQESLDFFKKGLELSKKRDDG
ncbi:MAG: polysaccharide pyruvyl transferase family protein [Candidatus Omnitrophota bacterium]|jgi:hypothetical protein